MHQFDVCSPVNNGNINLSRIILKLNYKIIMNTKIKNSLMPLLFSMMLLSAGNISMISAHSPHSAVASAGESDYMVEPWMNDVSYWNNRIADSEEKEITVSAWMVDMNYWNSGPAPAGIPGTADEAEITVEDWMTDLGRWEKNKKLCIIDRMKDAGGAAREC
jgi:hypothetical protein